MRRKPSFTAQLVTGAVLGIILTQQAALAQLGGPVTIISDTSPTSLKQLVEQTKQTVAQLKLVHTQDLSLVEQVGEYAREGSRWVETVRHYAQMVEQNLRRFTTLKGIMGFTEQQLGLDEDTLKAMASIGESVRGVLTLKNQFETLVTTRIRMIRNIEERARNGIFNPGADLADLEDYLRTSIGRSSMEVLATRERLARHDNELERWTHDLELARARKVALIRQRDGARARLEAELAKQTRARAVAADGDGAAADSNPGGAQISASATAIATLQKLIFDCDAEIAKLDKDISDLVGKITARYARYHRKFDESKHTAVEVEKTSRAWDDFMSVRNQAALEMLEGYHGDTPPRLQRPGMRRR